jgi:flagellar basal-body rod modification protein FlgD
MSTVNATTSSPPSPFDATSGPSRLPTKTLNQDDFLRLLVAQMTSQDPMNPQSNTDFAAQMAQFTSLEQTQVMASDLATMNTQQQLLQASQLLGRTVTLQADPQTTVSGVVQSVQINSGTPQILVNGKVYDLSQVLTISPASSTP